MPILPLIDLLILLGWTSVMVGVAQKAIWMSTVYSPTLLSLTPRDFLLGGAVCLLFALTLAARTWVKLNEARLLGASREEEAEAGTPARAARYQEEHRAGPLAPSEATQPDLAARG